MGERIAFVNLAKYRDTSDAIGRGPRTRLKSVLEYSFSSKPTACDDAAQTPNPFILEGLIEMSLKIGLLGQSIGSIEYLNVVKLGKLRLLRGPGLLRRRNEGLFCCLVRTCRVQQVAIECRAARE